MIKVVARSIAHPEHLEKIIELSKLLVDSSLLEPGCIDYGLFQDINDPNTLTMLETWVNQASLEAHKTSNHVKEIVPQLNALRKEKPIVHVYHPL